MGKRKVYFETEHERECKRLRPEFDPETELRNQEKDVKPTTIQISKPNLFFSIFSKSNQKHQKTCKQSQKSKPKSTPSRKKKSLTTVATQQGSDIRSYFQQNQIRVKPATATAVIATAAQQLPEQLEGGKVPIETKRINCGVRGAESGVNWDPGT